MVITRKTDGFIATVYYIGSLSLLKKNKKVNVKAGLVSKSVVLTDQNIREFIRFENELNYVEDGGCTTVDQYDIKGKYLTVHKTDGYCKWKGFENLKKSFFGNKN